MTPSAEPRPRVLVAGAGFVGRAVGAALAARGAEVRLAARRPAPGVSAVDLATPAGRARALADVDAAVWLVHSLDHPDYARRDPALAAAFARDAAARGVRRLVFLGALGPDDPDAPHTASRHATGRALAGAGVPTTELRASVVIGRGSAVVEMVRALALRLPVLPVPAGADAPTQPVALADAARALADAALAAPRPGTWELAGDDIVPWSAFMTVAAELLGRPRPRLQMPFATPRLSGLTLAALTPLSRTMGEALVRGLGRPAVVTDPARRWPAATWIGFRSALADALA
jgi:uncharacterized protein YbjT (DUF2867 family)